MKKCFKYIKFIGRIDKMGEATHIPGEPYYAFTKVRLIDQDGEVLNFEKLLVTKEMTSHLEVGTDGEMRKDTVTLYLLRHWNKKMLSGVLVAVQVDGQQFYGGTDIVKGVLTVVRSVSNRWSFLTSPTSAAVLGVLPAFGFFYLGALVAQASLPRQFEYGLVPISFGVAAAALYVYWFLAPAIRGRKLANIPEMEDMLRRDGFGEHLLNPKAKLASKY